MAVQCLIQPSTDGNRALAQSFCNRVRILASRGAPLPVAVVGLGDPAVLAPGTVALLVHGSVQASGGAGLLAFSIRAHRASGGEADILFGAAPRAVMLGRAGGSGPAVDAAIGAMLAETLPWQQRAQGPRRIDGRR